MRINAVIVTYNRKQLLLRCIRAVLDQNQPVNRLVVVDNASSDGTHEELISKGLAHPEISEIKTAHKVIVEYMRLDENLGGAGGFHYGMKQAVKDDPDYLWIMDDDGFPEISCLEKLLCYRYSHDYIMPISLDPDEKGKLSWFIKQREGAWTRSYQELCRSWKKGVLPHATPFNGLLLSRKMNNAVGFPNRHMFIWGDDWEHQFRCVKSGFLPVTVLDAKFFHPPDRSSHPRILFGRIPVNYTRSKLRFTCLIRNSTYNYWHYKGKQYLAAKFLIYSWFFLVNQKLALKEYLHYLKCVLDGIRGDFSRHLQYIENDKQ